MCYQFSGIGRLSRMTNLNANGAQSEMKSKNSNAQNEVFDSEQIHSKQLELPDGCKYLDESKITMDIETRRDELYNLVWMVPAFLAALIPGVDERIDLSQTGIPWIYYGVFLSLISLYYFIRVLTNRIPNDYIVLDKANKSIYLYEKTDEISDKQKSVYLNFEEIKFIAIDEAKGKPKAKYDFDLGSAPLVPYYTVKAISNDNRILSLTGRTDDFQKIDRFAKYLADLTHSEFLVFPSDGTQLHMFGNQPVYKKPVRWMVFIYVIVLSLVLCYGLLDIFLDYYYIYR